MNCQKRDQDLLLLAHGTLGGPRRVLLQAHVRRCPRCQEQRERFAAVSGHMAEAIRGELLPPWRSPARVAAARAGATASLRWSVVLALALFFGTIAAAAMVWMPEINPDRERRPGIADPFATPVGMTGSCGGCHPDLPAGHPGGSFGRTAAPAGGQSRH